MKSVLKVAAATTLTLALLALTGGVVGASAHSASNADAPSVTGKVIAVNGDVSVGSCGTAGASGNFIIRSGTTKTHLTTVNVTASTSFVEKTVSTPSFANVCVGFQATAIGNNTAHSMNALAVRIFAPTAVNRFGQVTAVNGSPTPGACGTAGARGVFTLVFKVGGSTVVDTVDVYRITKFHDPQLPGATFADVCVGDNTAAEGPTSGTRSSPRLWSSTPPRRQPTPRQGRRHLRQRCLHSWCLRSRRYGGGIRGDVDRQPFDPGLDDQHHSRGHGRDPVRGERRTVAIVCRYAFRRRQGVGLGTYSSVVLEASAVAAYPPAS